MAPLWILWPLRKAATIPIAIISSVGFGAAWGSYELTQGVFHTILPAPRKPREWTQTVAMTTAIFIGAGVVGFSRSFLRPAIPPYVVHADDVSLRSLRDAAGAARYAVINYPYRWLSVTVFASGAAAGLGHVLTERAWNEGRGHVVDATK